MFKQISLQTDGTTLEYNVISIKFIWQWNQTFVSILGFTNPSVKLIWQKNQTFLSILGVTNPTTAPCVDKLPNCLQFGPDVCTNPDYASWSKTNCPKFCNKCGKSMLCNVINTVVDIWSIETWDKGEIFKIMKNNTI